MFPSKIAKRVLAILIAPSRHVITLLAMPKTNVNTRFSPQVLAVVMKTDATVERLAVRLELVFREFLSIVIQQIHAWMAFVTRLQVVTMSRIPTTRSRWKILALLTKDVA